MKRILYNIGIVIFSRYTYHLNKFDDFFLGTVNFNNVCMYNKIRNPFFLAKL